MTQARCPIDGTPLHGEAYEDGIWVARCTRCGGAWLDRARLEAIQKAHEHDFGAELAHQADLGSAGYELARQKARPARACPACGREMEAREYARTSGILIDVCPACDGVWLDRGELEGLELFFERARLAVHPARRLVLWALRTLVHPPASPRN